MYPAVCSDRLLSFTVHDAYAAVPQIVRMAASTQLNIFFIIEELHFNLESVAYKKVYRSLQFLSLKERQIDMYGPRLQTDGLCCHNLGDTFHLLFHLKVFPYKSGYRLHNSATKALMASSVKCCITTTWASLPPKRVSSFCASWYLWARSADGHRMKTVLLYSFTHAG